MSIASSREIQIRELRIDDAEAAARLSGELGYPVSEAVMADRIRSIIDLPDHASFVDFK